VFYGRSMGERSENSKDQLSELGAYTWAFLDSQLPADPKDRREAMNRIAKKLNISERMMDFVVKRERNLGADKQVILAKHFGLTHLQMLNAGKAILEGEHPDLPRCVQPEKITANVVLLSQMESTPEIPLENYYAAPLVEGSIAAGHGRAISEDEIKSYVWIYAPELEDRISHNLISIEVSGKDGESMMPTLYPRDLLLLDKDDPGGAAELFKSGMIYAIRDGRGGTMVKRVYKSEQGFVLISDNYRNYPPIIVDWTNSIHELVIGRVVWGWRNLLNV
jgi:phage repressor protein C with HTH and peptisase S24 domain